MFMYKIFTDVTNQTLYHGLIVCLDTLRKKNPGWDYHITEDKDVHLRVLDFTAYRSLDEIPARLTELIPAADAFKTLILLSSGQDILAHHLIQTHQSSLLCVDERQIHLREIIESTVKKRRYISPLFCNLHQPMEKVSFTKAEKKVIAGLKEGCSGAEIAHKCHRSQKTISSHKRRIMQKLGVKNDVGLYSALTGG
ncbi:LuxR C-terminal-related transcriptional regulator [Enterobacter sp. SAT-E-asb]|uniref:helix-turn-helix transcriptional regulator n=1 Tax=unclassified Enterobacter TaxID=2608935 RepID=UPI0035307E55